MPGIVKNVGKNNGELHDVGNISPVEQANAKCGTENVCSPGARAREPACVRACVSAFVFLVRFVVLVFLGGREGEVLRDGEEEQEQELEDGARVGVGRSAHTAQGGRSACQVQVHAGTRQDPTHSQPW